MGKAQTKTATRRGHAGFLQSSLAGSNGCLRCIIGVRLPRISRQQMIRPIAPLVIVVAMVVSGGSLEAQRPLGTWELLSRTDSSAAGVQPADGPLGADPIAWIIYDRRGHVAAQLMARDRGRSAATSPTSLPPDPNNSAASSGYDAYFGTYEVDSVDHSITHHLLAALSPADVGRTLKRTFLMRGDTLLLSFTTRRADGTSVSRRLVWRRIAP